MSETVKHTPGPWRAVAMGGSSTVLTPTMPPKNDTRSHVAYGYEVDGEYCIAHPFLYQAEPGDPREETRMDFVCFGHADARLIAAAPDLLEALKELLHAYSEPDHRLCCDGRDCGCMGSTVHQQAEHYARAALTKAGG